LFKGLTEALEQLVRLETALLLAEQVSCERLAARERKALKGDAMKEVLMCYTHTHTHTHTRTHTHKPTHIHVCIYIYIHVCMYVYIYMYVCVCVCVCVCVYNRGGTQTSIGGVGVGGVGRLTSRHGRGERKWGPRVLCHAFLNPN
jgi:hypothetical protein